MDDVTKMSQYSDTVYKLIYLAHFIVVQASLVPQRQRIHLPMQKCGFDPWVEEEIATHSSIFPGKSHGQRSLVGYSPWGCKRVGHDLETKQQQISVHFL